MSFPATVPAAVIDLVVGFLLPLIIGACGGDARFAKATALRMLVEHHARTGNELLLAGSAICYRLRGLAMLAQSVDPDLPPESVDLAVKAACSLSRTGQQAQRRLDELQRVPPRSAEAAATADDAPPPASMPEGAEGGAPQPTVPGAAEPPVQPERTAVAEAPEGTTRSEVVRFETKLRSAETLLTLMKASWKGAPPPHSKAAQDIRAQQRVVDAARMALAQARRRQASAVA